MIMTETILLSLFGGSIGIILGILFTLYFGNAGIDLSVWGTAYASMGYDSIIYPILTLRDTVVTTIMVLGTGLLASIYPAIKALKLKPAEAIRIDM